ncbi:TPA: hypothetical protein LTW74_001425 [Enterobacter hormaechei]|nr:hypothetical protein [Enterobacter hormaechei]
MKVNNGGPAFPHLRKPVAPGVEQVITDGGMTLRDYFAAKAMQAFITGAMSDGTPLRTMDGDDKVAAKAAYIIADAMLKERG